jgi:methionine synthase / methylenetetrahydrofolate reductase(NADPH)
MPPDGLEKISHAGKPLICLEVNPPRGTDLEPIFARLDGQVGGIDFFNVTDSALARMRLAALPFASVLRNRYGIEPLANVSCRDRNLIAIQADLLAAWVTGVRSIVALTGDAVSVGDSPERKGVFEVNSIGLLHALQTLNSGTDLNGHTLKGKTAFISGVVVNPNAKNPEVELRRLQRKKEAGACYALSQPVFDAESATQFFSQAQKIGVPVFMGVLPFKSAQAALGISKVPGIRISGPVLEMLEKAGSEDLSDFFIEHCLKLCQANLPYVRGFHVISGATPMLAQRLAAELVKWREGL